MSAEWIYAKAIILFAESVFVGQAVPWSQDPLLRHGSLSVLRHVRLWRQRLPHRRILLKGERIIWGLQRSLHSNSTSLPGITSMKLWLEKPTTTDWDPLKRCIGLNVLGYQKVQQKSRTLFSFIQRFQKFGAHLTVPAEAKGTHHSELKGFINSNRFRVYWD